MKRLFIAGGLVSGLGLVIACSDAPQEPAQTPVARGGGTAQGGSGGMAAGSGGTGGSGGDVGGTGGTGGSGGTGGGSACATDCKALGQQCDTATAACVCPAYAPNHCPATNECADFTDDTENCGACGTVCSPIQACSASLCTPDPVEIYTTAAGCMRLNMLLEGANVYFINVGTATFHSVPAAGGAATDIAVTGLTAPTAFTIAATNVYVADGMTIKRFPLAGGAAETVVTETTQIYDVAFQTDVLYYPTDLVVKSVAADAAAGTGTIVATAIDAGLPQSVAVSGTLVFWGASGAFNVEVDPIEGDALLKLGASQSSLIFGHRSLHVEGTNVYWANGGSLIRHGFDLSTNSENVGGTKDLGNITAFAINATHGYYAADGNIEKGAVGADAIWMTRGQAPVYSMVVDATSLYWSTDACKIFKTPL